MGWLKRLVLERGLVSDEALLAVERWAPFGDAGLAERLWRAGLVGERPLLALFLEQGAQDATDGLIADLPRPAALGALTRDVAARCRAVPLEVAPGRVVVGMLDPADAAAMEEIAFFTGLAVEPRAVRASVLFRTLHAAYGLDEVQPEPELRARLRSVAAEEAEGDGDVLPPPTGPLPAVHLRADESGAFPVAEGPERSPLAAGIARAAGLYDGAAPSSPAIFLEEPREEEPVADAERTLQGRDSLPPQVLPLLSPPFRSAVLFLVRDDVAVGWDGRGPGVETDDVRGVLLPLTADSAFKRAREWRMVAAGTSHKPSITERIFFRFLKVYPPEYFAVLPIIVGERVVALLYVDKAEGALDEDLLASARQVGTTLADGLAPLVAEGSLFGPQG